MRKVFWQAGSTVYLFAVCCAFISAIGDPRPIYAPGETVPFWPCFNACAMVLIAWYYGFNAGRAK